VPRINEERPVSMAELLEKLETILVVDDTSLLLNAVVAILKRANYSVLQADSGQQALEVAANHPGYIDLLLSDVQMPLMSGPELGGARQVTRPDIRLMFMSGFAGGNLLVLNYGWAFIEKPFVRAKLLEMINGVQHSPNKSQGSHQYDTRKDSGRQEWTVPFSTFHWSPNQTVEFNLAGCLCRY
jgi:two-component system cell cycle sensor histidine kinase/response regulator CckA